MYDAIVVGLGGLGSAAAYALALKGKRVLGLERYAPAHSSGSSHDGTRIIRKAYFEDPAYVPLVLHAYELWEGLERETGEELLELTGGLMLGAEDGELVAGSVGSARAHDLPHEIFDHCREIRRRFPGLAPPTTPSPSTKAARASCGPSAPWRRTSRGRPSSGPTSASRGL